VDHLADLNLPKKLGLLRIPGEVKLSLEIRDLDESKIDFLFKLLQ